MTLFEILATTTTIAVLAFGVYSGFHALMSKRDPRSATAWILMCVVVPAIGAVSYWILGVNRIQTKARKWQKRGRFEHGKKPVFDAVAALEREHPERGKAMKALERISDRVTRWPLLAGNRVEPLFNGEQAYPAMLEAIGNAEKSVYLCTYLFHTDVLGNKFVDALGATAARGVDVRVLVDGFGERYSGRPRVSKLLREREGVKVASFLPLALSMRGLRFNLRNHRKILVVDDQLGFTGGMNIGGNHLIEDPDNEHPTADLHFRLRGPIVRELRWVFFDDWYFATEDEPPEENVGLAGPQDGDALCRAISAGPNEDFEVLTWILVGALSVARERVQIMTPYLLPDRELLSALNAAALRGVNVEVILPEKNNLPFVAWAMQAMLGDVIQYGTKVFYQPKPFDHTKLLIVDEFYVVMGSANLDPRSLRLNFEFNVEVYSDPLAAELSRHFDAILGRSRRVTREDLDRRHFVVKVRDAMAKLASPYL